MVQLCRPPLTQTKKKRSYENSCFHETPHIVKRYQSNPMYQPFIVCCNSTKTPEPNDIFLPKLILLNPTADVSKYSVNHVIESAQKCGTPQRGESRLFPDHQSLLDIPINFNIMISICLFNGTRRKLYHTPFFLFVLPTDICPSNRELWYIGFWQQCQGIICSAELLLTFDMTMLK